MDINEQIKSAKAIMNRIWKERYGDEDTMAQEYAEAVVKAIKIDRVKIIQIIGKALVEYKLGAYDALPNMLSQSKDIIKIEEKK